MNRPGFWLAELERVGPQLSQEIKSGLSLAEDSNPTYRALALILAQQAKFETTCLLSPSIVHDSREYQRGRVAMIADLHDTIVQLATTAKLEG